MSSYAYSSLSPEGENIRLLRLLPNEDEAASLQCELCNYSLQQKSGPRTHLYEALSYVWGNPHETLPIYIDKHQFPVTINLHAALLRLRDHTFVRIIWVDAICINQESLEERGQQVRLMAKIYSNAHRIIVWLGETAKDVDGALEDIWLAANGKSIEYAKKKKIIELLHRPWFQRIWVLQEVAAARHVVIICGPIEVDGDAFSLGLKSLELSYTASPKLQSLPSLINLIGQAGLRSKYTTNFPERFSLEIGRLAELVDMFHTREASVVHDKVYALLGMSSDDLDKANLQPDYRISWETLFQQFVKFVLGKDVFVEASGQRAVIKCKGYILGQVSSVKDNDGKRVNIESRNAAWNLGGKEEWVLHASAKPIQERDIICLLPGASKPTIIRLYKDHFAIIVIAAYPLNGSGSFGWPDISQSITQYLRDFILVWDWESPLERSQDQEDYRTLIRTYNQELGSSKVEFEDNLDKVTRLWNDIAILDDLGEYKTADERLLEARNSYMTVSGKEYLPKHNSEYARTLLSFVAGEGHEDIVKVLLKTVDPDLKDGKSGETPLWCAARNGHEAVVKLLLETGKVSIYRNNREETLLSWAAENGRIAIVKLLLETGKFDADFKNYYGRTPLSLAGGNGHEAVVKLLLQTGKVNPDLRGAWRRTPLSYIAENGYEAIVKLLLETGKVDANSKDEDGWTPLFRAAYQGHEAVVKLLLETGKIDIDLKDELNRTPLLLAASNGYEAVVKLLLDTDKVDADSKYDNGWTPLLFAAEGGHEAVVKLLLETGKVDTDLKGSDNRTLLSLVAGHGHNAFVKLLLETYKVVADSKDNYNRTPLSWAARGGHETTVKLLLETGKVDVDLKDMFGDAPLSLAAQNGHEAVVKLLLNTGKVDTNSKNEDSETPLSLAAKRGHEDIVKLLLETSKVD